METRASYALIGAFLLASILAVGSFALWLGQAQFNREFAEYDVIFTGAVNGLGEGGSVRYLGIKVGEVTEISLDPEHSNRVIARIQVDQATPIREDSTAILDFVGLTGVTFIQIQPGQEDSPRLPARMGSDVPVIQTEQTQFAEFIAGGADLIRDGIITLGRINAFLDEDNEASIRGTLDNIELLTGSFASDDALLTDLKEAISSFSRAGESVADIAASFEGIGDTANTEIAAIAKETRALLTEMRETVARADNVLAQAGTDFSDAADSIEAPLATAASDARILVKDMRQLVRRLDRVARELEQNPQAFIQGQPRPYAEENRR